MTFTSSAKPSFAKISDFAISFSIATKELTFTPETELGRKWTEVHFGEACVSFNFMASGSAWFECRRSIEASGLTTRLA